MQPLHLGWGLPACAVRVVKHEQVCNCAGPGEGARTGFCGGGGVLGATSVLALAPGCISAAGAGCRPPAHRTRRCLLCACSLFPAPEPLSDFYLAAFLDSLRDQGYTIFVVGGGGVM